MQLCCYDCPYCVADDCTLTISDFQSNCMNPDSIDEFIDSVPCVNPQMLSELLPPA